MSVANGVNAIEVIDSVEVDAIMFRYHSLMGTKVLEFLM